MLLFKGVLRVRYLLVEEFAVDLVALKELFHFLEPLQQDFEARRAVDQLSG